MALTRNLRVLISVLPLAGACGQYTPPDAGPGADAYVDGHGRRVALSALDGRYVWIDYAAEWCAACAPQTRAIQSVSRNGPENLVFITVITSERGGYGHSPDARTAARWAARFGLDPQRVWARDLSAWTLPRHRMLSPSGEILFDQTGEMSASEIRSQIDRLLP